MKKRKNKEGFPKLTKENITPKKKKNKNKTKIKQKLPNYIQTKHTKNPVVSLISWSASPDYEACPGVVDIPRGAQCHCTGEN